MKFKKYKLGIIAYGSLIDEPGEELEAQITQHVKCETPFKIEYARLSKTRGMAPTLIPVSEGGSTVNAVILALKDDLAEADAKSILWRRETRRKNKTYEIPNPVTANSILVESVDNFNGFEKVLYTRIGSNIEEEITPEVLANYAINSILTQAGIDKKDGLRYLSTAINNGIITPLTNDYVAKILEIIPANSLDSAIAKLDIQRIEKRFNSYLDKTAVNHEKVADLINAENNLTKKFKIFGQHYSFLQSGGRIFTKDKNGFEVNKILCCCANCQKEDAGFKDKYAQYEPFLKSEFDELNNLVQSVLPYSEKLRIWDAIVGGKATLQYDFNGNEQILALTPLTSEDVKIENEFYYAQMLRRYYHNHSSMQKYFGKAFETRKANYIVQYELALFKEELKTKTIDGVRDNSDKLRFGKSVELFNCMVDGIPIDYSKSLFTYSDMFSIVAATEDYLFLKFIQNYPEISQTENYTSKKLSEAKLDARKNNNMDMAAIIQPSNEKINVFVTYAWENDEQTEKVISFTNELRKNGFEAVNDIFLIQQSASADLQAMMLKQIKGADKVIVILSKKYAEKADKMDPDSGVGMEYQLILKDIEYNLQKYILVSFEHYDISLFPLSFRKRELISLTDATKMEYLFRKLKGIAGFQFSEVAEQTPVLAIKAIPDFQLKKKHDVNVTMPDSYDDDTPNVWDISTAENELNIAVEANDLGQIKSVIQNNSFLLYDIYERKGGALPIFHNIPIGKNIIDFAWLNDSSSGPEWVLLHIAEPGIEVIDTEGKITKKVLDAIETVKALANYFELNPSEKKRILGAVAKFKFLLIIGRFEQWQREEAQKWRLQHNKTSNIEIRSYNTFTRSIAEINEKPGLFYRFNQFHSTSSHEKLEDHWKSYSYMDDYRKWL